MNLRYFDNKMFRSMIMPFLSSTLVLSLSQTYLSKTNPDKTWKPHWILFPALSLSSPDKYMNFTMSCNPMVMTGKPTTEIKLDSLIPFKEQESVPGYRCAKFIKKISCASYWSGFEYEISSTPSMISPNECKNAIAKHKTGLGGNPSPEYATCKGMSTQTKDTPVIEVEPLTIPFDPFISGLIHPMFQYGICRDLNCESVHTNMYWIANPGFNLKCRGLKRGKSILYLDEYGSTDGSVIESDSFPGLPLKTGCRGFHYCGMEGMLLEHNFLLLIVNGSDLWNELKQSLQVCKDKVGIKEITVYELSLVNHIREIESLDRDMCYSIESRYKKTHNMSLSDLIYFTPFRPGKGWAYQLINDSLYYRNVQYERISDFDIDCFNLTGCRILIIKPNQGHYLLDTQLCAPPRKTMTKLNIVCMWFNGIGFGGKQMFYPHQEYMDNAEALYMQALTEGIVVIPQTVTPDDPTDSDDTSTPETNNTDSGFLDGFYNFFSDLKSVLSLVGGIILLLILLRCGWMYRCKTSKKDTKIELVVQGNNRTQQVQERGPKKTSETSGYTEFIRRL